MPETESERGALQSPTLPATARPRFAVDHMVIRLGKYLRILGYDAVWDLELRTHDLIGRANAEGRVFVTRNRRLGHQYPTPDRLLLLRDTDPVQQLRAVVEQEKLDPRAGLFTKCIRCNVLLEPVPDPESVRERVHPNVYAAFREFFRCPACATVFWRGSHVRNTCRKLGLMPSVPG